MASRTKKLHAHLRSQVMRINDYPSLKKSKYNALQKEEKSLEWKIRIGEDQKASWITPMFSLPGLMRFQSGRAECSRKAVHLL